VRCMLFMLLSWLEVSSMKYPVLHCYCGLSAFAQASMMCNDPSQPSKLCLPALQLIVNRSSLKQPCLQQQRILGLPDAWHHSVHYKAAFCINNTYTLALAAGHMPALHVKINSLQFPSSKDKL